ncbi:hypothetical protein [Aliidiomarina celeris]|uniref:hypothetical protein n=1 Tax=Aliidiomarina celeris TaxID=2249428 RepID=UPI000DEA605A|nr:hypothetical protein [Aliidiomarina celeris]
MLKAKTLICLFMLVGLMLPAQAMDIRSGIAEPFHEVYALIEQGKGRAAERALDSLKRAHGNTADYHFIAGQVDMLKMNDASMMRMPFIARSMRKSWEKAVEINPNHEVSVFSLAMFYFAAPGIVGGDKEKAGRLMERLEALESGWQFPLRVTFLMNSESDQYEAIEQAYNAWFEAYPNLVSARMNYVFMRNNSDDRSKVLEQLQIIDRLVQAEPEQVSAEQRAQIDYQWGKMAAETGLALEQGRDRLLTLLAENNVPENIGNGFVHARLSAIYQQLNEQESAQQHYQQAQALAEGNSDLVALLERLEV